MDELQTAYRSTYQDYARKSELLQQLRESSSPDPRAIEGAILALQEARLAYNAARDRLAAEFGGMSPQTGAAAAESTRLRVSETAHLLWEMAGRPEGTAERDWNRAERLVRTADRAL